MRFISMKHFSSPEAKKRVVGMRETVVLGQIIGEVLGSAEKIGRLPDGSEQKSVVLIGDFAGVCYEKQAQLAAEGKDPNLAEMAAESLYMPKWYTEQVLAKLGASKRIEFAVEVIMAPTPEGQSVMFQYDVRSLIARPAHSPVERMKRTLQQNGILRLSPPAVLDARQSVTGPGESAQIAHDPETGEIAGDDAEGQSGDVEFNDPEMTEAVPEAEKAEAAPAKPASKSHKK